ncbi:MAG: hypothetical protein P8I31_01970 [Bacteroidia bacterium]|nr:hypothetical protein [Bacteroidia bacterium]
MVPPGDLVEGDDYFEAFNDLLVTKEKINSIPSKTMSALQQEIDYELFFNEILGEVRNEIIAKEIQSFMINLELAQVDINAENINLQNTFSNEKQKLDSLLFVSAEFESEQHEFSLIEIEKLKVDNKKLSILNSLEQEEREKGFSNTQNKLDNGRRIISNQYKLNNDSLQVEFSNQRELLNYQIHKSESKEKKAAENRVKLIQETEGPLRDVQMKPNYLKDTSGKMYPFNEMTQRVFKKTNSAGEVISVTIQRVVVDERGYGVVYEKTSNLDLELFYTSNGVPITEDIWFNESTGVNVIKD